MYVDGAGWYVETLGPAEGENLTGTGQVDCQMERNPKGGTRTPIWGTIGGTREVRDDGGEGEKKEGTRNRIQKGKGKKKN